MKDRVNWLSELRQTVGLSLTDVLSPKAGILIGNTMTLKMWRCRCVVQKKLGALRVRREARPGALHGDRIARDASNLLHIKV